MQIWYAYEYAYALTVAQMIGFSWQSLGAVAIACHVG